MIKLSFINLNLKSQRFSTASGQTQCFRGKSDRKSVDTWSIKIDFWSKPARYLRLLDYI